MKNTINVTIDRLVSELNNKGYQAESQTVTKNNAVLNGIIIRAEGSNVAPCIYIDDYLKQYKDMNNEIIGSITNKIIEAYEANKMDSFDGRTILAPEYMYANAYVNVQQKSTEDLVKQSTIFEGIEQYIYLKVNMEINNTHQKGGIKLSPEHLTAVPDLNVDELWKHAKENTFEESEYYYMGLMPGMGFDIFSNHEKWKGAAAMLHPDLYKELNKGNEFVVIPSSIHEVIVMAINKIDKDRISELSKIVKEVNACAVKPEEWLSNNAYILNVKEWKATTI